MTANPTHLKYFLEIAEQGSFSKASRRIAIAQPALTIAIKNLERSLGVQLFVRSKKGVVLTKAGKLLELKAKKHLTDWDEISAAVMSVTKEAQGTYSLACYPTIASSFLPMPLTQVLEENLKMGIKLVHLPSSQISQRVIDSEVDLGIVVNPLKHPDLIIHLLAKDRVGLYTKMNGPKLAFKNTIIYGTGPQTDWLLRRTKLSLERRIESSDLNVIATLTGAGMGYGILPESIAKNHRLIASPSEPFYSDEICLIFRKESRELKAIKLLSEAFRKAT